MKELVFHIDPHELVIRRWSEYPEEQQKDLARFARKWELLDYNLDYDSHTFTGNTDMLYQFLHDLSFKYDISLI